MMQQTLYHSLLRIASLSVALVLAFDSGLVTPATLQISQQTQQYLASVVGIQASVESNDINILTAELTRQKQALDEREAALSEREISVDLNNSIADVTPVSTLILSLVLFILLVLIVLNYVLDYLRQTQARTASQSS